MLRGLCHLTGTNEFLAQINNEGKVRRSTKSDVVGRAKVMVWEDIDKARAEIAEKKRVKETKRVKREKNKAEQEAKKAEKDNTKAAGKSTRVRKRKACLVASDAPEPSAKSPLMSEVLNPVVLQMDG
jgi:hypothetical protein